MLLNFVPVYAILICIESSKANEFNHSFLQCFDAVGWVTTKCVRPVKSLSSNPSRFFFGKPSEQPATPGVILGRPGVSVVVGAVAEDEGEEQPQQEEQQQEYVYGSLWR